MMDRVGYCQIMYTYGKNWLLFFPFFPIFSSPLPLFFLFSAFSFLPSPFSLSYTSDVELCSFCGCCQNLCIAKTFLSHLYLFFPPLSCFLLRCFAFPYFPSFLPLFLSCSLLLFFFPISLFHFPFFFVHFLFFTHSFSLIFPFCF